jgi:DNA-binding transcriptional ArsR family regulator
MAAGAGRQASRPRNRTAFGNASGTSGFHRIPFEEIVESSEGIGLAIHFAPKVRELSSLRLVSKHCNPELRLKNPTRTKKVKAVMTNENEAPRRKRQSGVRGRILDMLSSGPMLANELVEQGKFSAASMHLNLKSLKADGLVDAMREGRAMRYMLSGAAPSEAGEAAPAGKRRGRKPKAETAKPRGRPKKTVASSVSGNLQDALGVLMARLSPIEQVDEKLMVLSQLAGSLPAPVAGVLNKVIDDLSRLAGKR